MSKKVTMKATKKAVAVKKPTLAKTKGDLKAKPVAKKAVPKKKVIAKKAVVKKAVAKKVTKKQAIKDKITSMYKIVSNYSENLMQDVYSVVYRTKQLKRFINTNLANKYIEQEVLLRMNEHAITTAKKSRAVSKELASEFE